MFRIHNRDVTVIFTGVKTIYCVPLYPLYFADEKLGNMNYMNIIVENKGAPRIEYSVFHPTDMPKPEDSPII